MRDAQRGTSISLAIQVEAGGGVEVQHDNGC
jgi:hypothetical protein